MDAGHNLSYCGYLTDEDELTALWIVQTTIVKW